MSELNAHIKGVRKDYVASALSEEQIADTPFLQFEEWMKVALTDDPEHANAMVLATYGEDSCPDARVVLLRDISGGGFTFFTNYLSKKGKDLEVCPSATLLFFWPKSERQIRITGVIQKLAEEDSEDYFNSRPFESKVGAHASAQSTVISSRQVLEEQYAEALKKYSQTAIVPRPLNWGGYVLLPQRVEFWQGRSSRLHDRLRYVLDKERQNWKVERLMP